MHDTGPGSRQQRLHAKALERRAIKTGVWGAWRIADYPDGLPGANPRGWCAQVRQSAANDLYSVLVRPVQTDWGLVHHCAIRTISSLEPPWRDKQRIKNELFNAASCAVEVMPPDAQLVDQAPMYHIWILPPGFALPFTLPR